MNSARSSLSYDSMSPREVSSTPSLGTRDSYSMQSTSTPSPREAADRSAPLLTLLAFAAERRSFECKKSMFKLFVFCCFLSQSPRSMCFFRRVFPKIAFLFLNFACFFCLFFFRKRCIPHCLWSLFSPVKNESPTRVEIPHNTSSRSSAPPAPAAPSNATSSTTRNGEFVSFAPRSSERKRAKKRASHDMEIGGTSCAWCGKTQTPQWRRCRQTQETLCNSCGLKSARRERKLKAQRTQLLQQQQDNDY